MTPVGAGHSPPADIRPLRPEDDPGLWALRVGGGRGSLEPFITEGGAPVPPAGPVTLGARGFGALYAGVPMATLRGAGLAAGGDVGADEALDCAFAASAFMLDAF